MDKTRLYKYFVEPYFLLCKCKKICYNKNMRNNFEEKKENKGLGFSLFGQATPAKASGIAFSLAAVLPTGLSFLFLIAIQVLGLAKEGYASKNWYLYASYLITPLAFFLVAVWYFLFYKGSFTRSVKRQKCKPKYYLVALLLQVGLFSLSQANTWFLEFLARFGYQPTEIVLPSMDGVGIVGVLLTVAVLPALFEEIIFRGVLLDGLHSFGKVGAILLCGGLFALYHQNPMQTVYQFCCGAAFAFVALRSGSILPTMLAHFLNNAVIILLTKFGVASFSTPVLITVMSISGVCLIGTLVYLILDRGQSEEFSAGTLMERKKERLCFVGCSAIGIVVLAVTWFATLFMGIQG